MSQFSNLLSLLGSTSSEAEAAGLSTLMKRLGVTLDEAKAIKAAAVAKRSPGPTEGNIDALKKVRQYKTEGLPRFGVGADAEVFDAGNSVLKVPKKNVQTHPDNIKSQAVDAGAPIMLGDLGVPTRNIKTSENMYQIQDKLKTPKVYPGGDETFKQLDAEQSKLYDKVLEGMRSERKSITGTDDILENMPPEDVIRYKELEKLKDNRTSDMWREQGVDPDLLEKDFRSLSKKDMVEAQNTHNLLDDELKDYPMDTLAALTDMKARASTKAFRPYDVHAGNVGLDANNNAKIFDTSRFSLDDPSQIQPEQFQKIKESIIASPERKEQLLDVLRPQDSQMKKAAAVAPVAAATDPSWTEGMADSAWNTLSGAADIMSIPGAIGRTSINAVTENRAPTMDELKQAATFPTGPEQDALATKTTEKILPDSDDVMKRTALETMLKFM